MKRLALKRDRCEQNTNLSPIEISDDDSYDELSSLRRKIVHNDCKSKTSLNTVNVSSILKDTSNRQPVISAHSSQFVDNIPNDISDDDVIITKTPSTSNGRQSMFNWNKNLTSMPQHISEDNTLLDSECTKETPVEARNENNLAKPDLINIDDNYDDDNLNNLKREASPPKVTIHHDIMIAGTKVKFPVKPYSSQVAVMNNVSIIKLIYIVNVCLFFCHKFLIILEIVCAAYHRVQKGGELSYRKSNWQWQNPGTSLRSLSMANTVLW